MKAVSKVGTNILKIILGIITTILIIIIIINILNILCIKVLKKEYPTFLDFTYYIPENNDKTLDISKDDFLLIDLKQVIEAENIIVYKKENKFKVGQLIEKDTNSIIKNNSKKETIPQDQIIGKVSYIIPSLGNIIRTILKPIVFIISIIVLIITSILSSIIKKRTNKELNSKPNFNQTW